MAVNIGDKHQYLQLTTESYGVELKIVWTWVQDVIGPYCMELNIALYSLCSFSV